MVRLPDQKNRFLDNSLRIAGNPGGRALFVNAGGSCRNLFIQREATQDTAAFVAPRSRAALEERLAGES